MPDTVQVLLRAVRSTDGSVRSLVDTTGWSVARVNVERHSASQQRLIVIDAGGAAEVTPAGAALLEEVGPDA